MTYDTVIICDLSVPPDASPREDRKLLRALCLEQSQAHTGQAVHPGSPHSQPPPAAPGFCLETNSIL